MGRAFKGGRVESPAQDTPPEERAMTAKHPHRARITPTRPALPWARVAPLLRTGWIDPAAAWRCALEHMDIARRAAGWHLRSAVDRRDFEGSMELTQEILARTVDRAWRQGGLTPPSDLATRADAWPWLYRVFCRHAQSALRRPRPWGAMEQLATRPPGEAASPEPRHAQRGSDDVMAELVDQRRRLRRRAARRAREVARERVAVARDLERVLDLTLPLARTVAPCQALAWLALHHPTRLTRAHVERAAAHAAGGRVGTAKGLSRTAAETWALLEGWRDRGGARGELAWILRGAGSEVTWGRAEARRARGLLTQWNKRARRRLAKLAAGEAS